MNKFFINFIIQGGCKFLGFLKKDKILKVLGMTFWGDVYKLCYNWPNLFKKILIDGTLDFVITPYILEGKATSFHEFQKRNNQLINSMVLGISALTLLFFLGAWWGSSGPMGYFYRLFFLLIIPTTFNLIFNQILQAKGHFTYTNGGQVLNNLAFLMALYGLKKNLMGVWWASIVGFIAHNIYLLVGVLKKKYINFQGGFLPGEIIFNLAKTALFQLCNRLNHLVINFLGWRLLVPGILIGFDYVDNIIFSAIGLFAMTIIIISTPNFFGYFVEKHHHFKAFTQRILKATLVGALLISIAMAINAPIIIKIIMGNNQQINQKLLTLIFQWTSPQVVLLISAKILQRILTLQKKINKTLAIALASSLFSVAIEVFFFKKYHVYSIILSEYCFVVLEIVTMIFLLKSDSQWRQLWDDFSWSLAFTYGIRFFIATAVGLFLKSYITGQGPSLIIKFCFYNGIWASICLMLFWSSLKVFLMAPSSH